MAQNLVPSSLSTRRTKLARWWIRSGPSGRLNQFRLANELIRQLRLRTMLDIGMLARGTQEKRQKVAEICI